MERLDDLSGELVGIFGFGNTGKTVYEIISNVTDEITVYEDNAEKLDKCNMISDNDSTAVKPSIIDDDLDRLIVSPGIPGNHPVLRQARELSIPVMGELELSYQLIEGGEIWAITGTNGKSTCADLAGELLSQEYAHDRVSVCGNRGSPMLENVIQAGPDHHYVVEVSSFQVENLIDFSPDATLLTSLDSDHQDYHDSLREYWGLKLNLLRRTKSDGSVVVPDNVPDRWVPGNCSDNLRRFNTHKIVNPKATISNQELKFKNRQIDLADVDDYLKLFSENIMAVTALLFDEVSPENLETGLKSFQQLDYRVEEIETNNGRRIINDSKGTNPEAVQKLVSRLGENLSVVLGGEAKDTNYDELVQSLRTTQNTTITLVGDGSTTQKLKTLLQNKQESFNYYTKWKQAVKNTYRDSDPDQTIVLSPGGTSFDAFENYRDRGKSFERWIKEVTND